MNAPDTESIACKPWSPSQASELLNGCAVEWVVVGGWALDLWRGAQTRPHKNLEVAVLRPALGAIRKYLADFEFLTAEAGRLTRMASVNCPQGRARQHWVLGAAVSKGRLDVMVEPGDDHTWVYRRDPRISASRLQVIATSAGGVPYLRPRYVLLFKAQQPRAVNELDFSASIQLLESDERLWLREAISLSNPSHPWIERLK